MPTSRTMTIRLGQYFTAPRPADADLLARFVATRDAAAFAELVRRHGPAILAVCRRITGNRHDAEDAFQVTFLVLARKADRVRPATALGGWLYGVAVRAARKALARSCRRRNHEVAVGELPEVPHYPAVCDPDAVRVVLEEVALLPQDQRAAVVLCELEGRPRTLAARELGIPEGTLSSRLAAARKRLAALLRDRGLAPAVLAVVAGTAACPVLAAEAVRLGAAPVSPGIEMLMEAVMRSTFGIKLKLAVVAVVAVVAVGLSVVGAKPPNPADPPVEMKQRADAPTPGGRLLLMKGGGFAVLAPDGKALATMPLPKDAPGVGLLSPDGKQVAYIVPTEPGPNGEDKAQIVVRDAVGGLFTATTTIDVEAIQLYWSPDGKTLYASVDEGTDEKNTIAATHRRIDLTARTVEKVDWPVSVWPLEWARDGKSVLVCWYAKAGLLLSLMSPDGKTLTDLIALREEDSSPLMVQARLSPDGRRVLYSDIAGKKEKKWNDRRLYMYDVTTKKRTEVADVPRNAIVHNCCWSPDGKKIAYVWQERHEALDKKTAKGEDFTPEDVETETKMFVIVANADGSEARTVASMKGDNIRDLPFLGIDWRGYLEAPNAPGASDTPTDQARMIIEKAIQAHGGEANLAKVKIVRQKGTYRAFIDVNQEQTATWTQICQKPDRFKNVQEAVIDGQKDSLTLVLNGDKGWISRNGQTESLNKEMVAKLQEDLDNDLISYLLKLKKKDLSMLPEVKVSGRPAIGVKVSCKGREDVKLYFDKESGLLVKRDQRIGDDMGGKATQEEVFRDYKETENVELPRKVVTFTDGKKIGELIISEVQFPNKVDDREFEAPDAAPKPAPQLIPDFSPEYSPRPTGGSARPVKPTDLTWRPTKVAGPPGRYLVLVDPGTDDEFLPAAEAMAALHGADLKRFDPSKLDLTLAELRKAPPRFVVFVLPPEKIDVDLSHEILEMATKVDDDPFVDFEYGFVTGLDGSAALRFVQRIVQAWKREYTDKAMLFGGWEGPFLPPGDRMTAMEALGFSAKERFVKVNDSEEKRQKSARQILAECKGNDALLFMSHGYPDRMDHCFLAKDLRDWKVDLSPAILFNCACFNGAPGRWFLPNGKGYVDRGVIARDESVALALLDSGIAGYFAGVDAWHGPLNSQVFYYVTDDGMRLGEAANAMYNRLALEFLPDRIHFGPTSKLKWPESEKDWWTQNQRHNGAAMILYGDPAFAPFARKAKHLLSAKIDSIGKDRFTIKISVRPLVEGQPGEDYDVLPTNRLFDYYSLRSEQEENAKLELYRVLALPDQKGVPKGLRVVSAKCGDKDVPTGTIQAVVEETPTGKFLHVRVPVTVSVADNRRVMELVKQGFIVELEGSR